MVRDPHLPENQPDRDPSSDPGRRLAPMPPGPIGAALVLGLIGGWALHPVSEAWLSRTPSVGWVQVGVLWFLGGALVVAARTTARALAATPRGLTPQQAVNRLVMARACALVGGLVAGGYAGFAIGWIGTGASELLVGRLARPGLAAVAGIVILVASLALELACRAPGDDEVV